jgi:hypothetical protein
LLPKGGWHQRRRAHPTLVLPPPSPAAAQDKGTAEATSYKSGWYEASDASVQVAASAKDSGNA